MKEVDKDRDLLRKPIQIQNMKLLTLVQNHYIIKKNRIEIVIKKKLKIVSNAGNYSSSSSEKQHSGRKGIDLKLEPMLVIVSMSMPYFQ